MVQVAKHTTITLAPILPIRIFLSSPGDLFPMRLAVKDLIEELNRDSRYENRYKFILYAYEDRVPPIIAEEPQRSVDTYNLRPDMPAIFLCLFWKRLGTPTVGLTDPATGEVYPSGTVYELLSAYQASRAHQTPVILLYRRDAPTEDPALQSPEQEQALEGFLARFRAGGDLVGLPNATFTGAADLVNNLRDDLVRVIETTLRERLNEALRELRRTRDVALLLPPPLPDTYVLRDEALDELRRLALGTQQRAAIVALQGQGGLGKTVLAQALCYDPATRGAFPDGVLWAELGATPDILGEQRRWVRELGGDPAEATTVRDGTDELRRLLQERAVLLVLDNVWQQAVAEAFAVNGPRCHTLLTTRDALTAPGARLLKLDVMRRDESIRLLRAAGGEAVSRMLADEIAERLGDLPLALDLVAEQLRLGSTWAMIKRALDEQHNIKYLGLAQGKVYSVIASSVAALPTEMASRFHELAIFPPGEPLDRGAVARLWAATAHLSSAQTERMLVILHARSLLKSGDAVHDLVRDYLQLQFADHAERLRKLHTTLAASYGGPEQWPNLPYEEAAYAWRRLVWHLAQGGALAQARNLVSDGRFLTGKITLLGSEAAARDAELAAATSEGEGNTNDARQRSRQGAGDERMELLAAGLRRSGYVLDRDLSQLENQLYGRLGEQLTLHDMPQPEVALRLVWPSLAPAGVVEPPEPSGHSGGVNSCAFSPDGQLLATASDDGTARLWDVESGRILHVLTGHSGGVWGCALSLDGRLLATAGGDGTAQLWDVGSGKRLRTLSGHSDWVRGCAFSADGRLLATVSNDRTARLWDVENGKELRVLAHHGSWVNGCAFSPDGQLLATVGGDGIARLWEVSSGEERQTLSGHGNWVRGCAFSPDGRLLATVGGDGTAQLWEVSSGKRLCTLSGHRGGIWGCTFSPNGRLLATVSVDGTARVWDIENGRALHVLSDHSGGVWSCAFSPDGHLLATVGDDGIVKLWRVGSSTVRQTLSGHGNWVRGCAFSPDGRLLATVGGDGTAQLWEVSSGRTVRTLSGHDGTVLDCAFSPDNRLLATAGRDGTARLWEVSSGKELSVFAGHDGWAQGCAFSPDNRLLATVGTDGKARLWEVSSGRIVRILSSRGGGIWRCVFSSNSRLLVAVSDDDTMRIWEVKSGKELQVLSSHSGGMWGCTFDPEGRLLATVGYDGTARLWQITVHEEAKRGFLGRHRTITYLEAVELRTLAGHSGGVWACGFSPDGRLLVTTSSDGTARLWEVDSGKELAHATLEGAVYAGAAHPRELLFGAGDASGRVHLLRVVFNGTAPL